jgi:thiosulfate reductase cytochrome b subunit
MIVKHQVRRGLVLGAVYLVAAIVVNELQRRDVVGNETVIRILGVLRGLIVVILANAVPKRLVPLADLYCDPVREQRLRRFAARVMLLGGLGYTLAYVLAPMAIVHTLAIWLLEPPGLVFGGILVRGEWARRKAKRSAT